MDTRRYQNDNEKYEGIIKKVGVKQMAIYSRELLKVISNYLKGKPEERKDAITLQIMYQKLNKINFFDESMKYHNSMYGIFKNKKMANPFILDNNKLEEQYMNLQGNTEVEIIAKKAQLENRFAKLCVYGRNKLIEQTAKNESKGECAKAYVNKIYKNILLEGKMEEFLDNGFKYYYKKEITKEEFEKLETSKLCKKFIGEENSTKNIDLEKAYIFSLYEHTHNNLMKEKAKDIAKIIRIYSKEQKQGIASFGMSVRNDARILGENNMSVSINIPNYSNPFKLHTPKTLIQDEERKNDINLEKQFRRNEIDIVTLPLKISTEQIEQMHELTRYEPFEFKNRRLYADERRMNIMQYMKDNIYIKREYQKQTVLNNIKQIKEKELELKQIKKEIQEKKETVRNLKEEIQTLKGNIEKSLED